MHKMMTFFGYSRELVGFSEFPVWFRFASIHFTIKVILLVSPVNLNILLVIFSVTNLTHTLFFDKRGGDKRITVEKNLADYKDQ